MGPGGKPPTPPQKKRRKKLPPELHQRPANGPNEIYKPYFEHCYAFKTPILRSEGGGGGFATFQGH